MLSNIPIELHGKVFTYAVSHPIADMLRPIFREARSDGYDYEVFWYRSNSFTFLKYLHHCTNHTKWIYCENCRHETEHDDFYATFRWCSKCMVIYRTRDYIDFIDI